MSPRVYLSRLAERHERVGDAKMLTIEPLDHDIVRAAGLEAATWLHPAAMYARFRLAFAHWQSADRVARFLEPAPLPRPEQFPEPLPSRYVVAKMYFGDCLPARPEARSEADRIVAEEAGGLPVVSITTGTTVDDHTEWSPECSVVEVTGLDPATNLADQTRIVARAERLIAPYGGYSYLGAFLGVPTSAIKLAPAPNELALRRAARIRASGEFRIVERAGGKA